jgi:2',3'-cyclic-nucleotide 2'-phosphodiesterase (5'-nucleotidase family)
MRVLARAVLFLFAVCAFGADFRSEPLVVYYTSSLNGNLDGCDCTSNPKAGLVKRAAYLRERDRQSSILLEIGDIFDPRGDEPGSDHILQIYKELDYDAIVVGDQEFANGVENVLLYKEDFPLRSNNISVCPDDTACYFISLGPLILERGDWRVGIVSVTDPNVFYFAPDSLKEKLKIEDPAETARMMLEGMAEEDLDIKILIVHGRMGNVEEIAAASPGYDVIIAGHDQMLVKPKRVGDAVIVSPGEEGNRLGMLTIKKRRTRRLNISNSFHLFDYEKDPDDPDVRERIEAYKDSLRNKLKTSNERIKKPPLG